MRHKAQKGSTKLLLFGDLYAWSGKRGLKREPYKKKAKVFQRSQKCTPSRKDVSLIEFIRYRALGCGRCRLHLLGTTAQGLSQNRKEKCLRLCDAKSQAGEIIEVGTDSYTTKKYAEQSSCQYGRRKKGPKDAKFDLFFAWLKWPQWTFLHSYGHCGLEVCSSAPRSSNRHRSDEVNLHRPPVILIRFCVSLSQFKDRTLEQSEHFLWWRAEENLWEG